MAGFTASWIHGNAVVMEKPPNGNDGSVVGFDHIGLGTQIYMNPGGMSWFHIPIPTPVIIDTTRMKLIRVFLQVSRTIDDLHLYDGQNRVAMLSDGSFHKKPGVSIPGNLTFELFTPREWVFGVGLSFHLIGTVDNPIVIGGAGADFVP